MRFQGKRMVVTGGASGIGRATAQRLASEGAEVWIGDIDDVGGKAAAAQINGTYRHCDVRDVGQIAALIAEADDAGGIDGLFNNAGAGGARGRIDELSADDWDRTHALLLRSVAMGIRYAAPLMAARGGGAIVNTASIAGVQSGAAPIAYSVAKAGVTHLTKIAAAELARGGVRVNAVLPGFIATNIFASAMGVTAEARGAVDRVIAGAAPRAQPIARAGTAEDVAAAVAYLLSEDAGFVTGTSITVDGGMTIGPQHVWDPDTPGLFDLLDRVAAR